MHTLQLVGQVITCVNYTTDRIFNFNPEPLRKAAETYLACGVTELEVPQMVLDPDDRYPDTGLDIDAVRQTRRLLPAATRVIGTYLSSQELGTDNSAYLRRQKRTLSLLSEHFADVRYAMLHPASREFGDGDAIRASVDTYAQLAEYARSLRPDFQLCFHNHYDGNGESAQQVRTYLEAIAAVNSPALRWGIDTAHSHGMDDEYLPILHEYAHLIGDFFHIKGRVAAFDQLHGGAHYRPERDIWSNPAEIGKGLYSGFVNVADPEMQTPLAEAFAVIRSKARPSGGVVRGALEIDVPRQHPMLEVLCATLYLTSVHGVRTTQQLSYQELVGRVFPARAGG